VFRLDDTGRVLQLVRARPALVSLLAYVAHLEAHRGAPRGVLRHVPLWSKVIQGETTRSIVPQIRVRALRDRERSFYGIVNAGSTGV
jgi:hypothetical protein